MGQASHPRQVVIPDEQEDRSARPVQATDARGEQTLQRRCGVLVLERVAREEYGVHAFSLDGLAELIEPIAHVYDALIETRFGMQAAARLHTEMQVGEMQQL
jgi:hypothetical protein